MPSRGALFSSIGLPLAKDVQVGKIHWTSHAWIHHRLLQMIDECWGGCVVGPYVSA